MRFLLTLALLATAGCSSTTGDEEEPTIATAFYPLAYVAEQVAGGLAEVENLTQPGAEPHDLSLSVGQTATVARADLVIHQAGFQPAVDETIEQNATGAVIDAAATVDLRRLPDGELDPHFWLDPLEMATLADSVADRLAELDPDNAGVYESNAAELRRNLESLDADYRRELADCERRTVVVSHDAFGYLTRYDLEFAPVAGLSPDAEPTATGLSQLQTLIRTEGITTVFTERLASPRLTQSLADDMGIGTAVLDPLEGLSPETSGEDYLSLMRQNLAALAKANGCRT